MSTLVSRKAQSYFDRRSRRARVARTLSIVTALAVSGIVVSQASYSAFMSQTTSEGNSWSTGEVTVTDDINGAAAFSVDGMLPGDSGANTVTVNATSDNAGKLRFFTQNETATNDLDKYVNMKVTRGTKDKNGKFTADADGNLWDGTLADMRTQLGSYAQATNPWIIPAKTTSTKTYEFEYKFADDAPTTANNSTVSADFVWMMKM